MAYYLTGRTELCDHVPFTSYAVNKDGNLIEIMDLGFMYHVLGWLGPLGGWIFRRGMYKQPRDQCR